MSGKSIVASVSAELEKQIRMGYDNYKYPDSGDSYSNDDADDSESELL
jgi:hypothetical protein